MATFLQQPPFLVPVGCPTFTLVVTPLHQPSLHNRKKCLTVKETSWQKPVNQWLMNDVYKTPIFIVKGQQMRSVWCFLFSLLFIYFDCVVYSLYAKRSIFKRRNIASARKWPSLHNGHYPLSLRSLLWRGSTVIVKFFVYFYFAEHMECFDVTDVQ